MEWNAGIAFVRQLNNIVAFFLVFPDFHKVNDLPKKRVMWMDDSYGAKI